METGPRRAGGPVDQWQASGPAPPGDARGSASRPRPGRQDRRSASGSRRPPVAAASGAPPGVADARPRPHCPRTQMPIQPPSKDAEEMEAEGDSAAEMNGEEEESEEERSSQTESEEDSSASPYHPLNKWESQGFPKCSDPRPGDPASCSSSLGEAVPGQGSHPVLTWSGGTEWWGDKLQARGSSKTWDALPPSKRKKAPLVSGPYIVYMLQEIDILEDWTAIKKARAAVSPQKRKSDGP
ncbi:PREDICTED: breast cancer metastasis-suppressor 1 [Condylura cristata]|uniref:breast cancer metastasis-suppressor 1 n=1 Tax=Condylura cristata TaxID=143302 RepID=UPI000642C9B3|nr:PREDICTED: breast cancer metastasis-suppressor 1 [Condylura cristata]